MSIKLSVTQSPAFRCLRNLVGDDVDATHYSWTYFESVSFAARAYRHTSWTLISGVEEGPIRHREFTRRCLYGTTS